MLRIIILWASAAAALGGGALILRCDENERVLGGGTGWMGKLNGEQYDSKR